MDKVGCEQITRNLSNILSFFRLDLVCTAKRTEEAGLREFHEMYKRARIVFVVEARHAAGGGQGGVQGKDHVWRMRSPVFTQPDPPCFLYSQLLSILLPV